MKDFREFLNDPNLLYESDGIAGPKSVGKRKILIKTSSGDIIYNIYAYDENVGKLDNMYSYNTIIDTDSGATIDDIGMYDKIGIVTLTHESGNPGTPVIYVVKKEHQQKIGAFRSPGKIFTGSDNISGIQNVISANYVKEDNINIPDLDPSFFDADSSGSAGRDSSGNPVPLSDDIKWDNLMSYISHLHSIIDDKVFSNIISEQAGRCMKAIIESVRSGTRLSSEMVEYLTEDIEGEKIGKQMKFFGEVLGPIAMISGQAERPWSNISPVAGWWFPDSRTYPLIDFVMYTTRGAGSNVVYPWKISSKMVTGGNTVKNTDLEKALQEPSDLWNLIEWNQKRDSISKKLQAMKQENPDVYSAIEGVRRIFTIIYEAKGAWWGQGLAAAYYGKPIDRMINENFDSFNLIESIYQKGNWDIDKLMGVMRQSQQNSFYNILSDNLDSERVQRNEIESTWMYAHENDIRRLAVYSRNIKNNLEERISDGEILVVEFLQAAGNYLKDMSENDISFSTGVKEWFNLIVTDQVFYLFCGYDAKTATINWITKGEQTIQSDIPSFNKISLRAKDKSNAIGFSVS